MEKYLRKQREKLQAKKAARMEKQKDDTPKGSGALDFLLTSPL